MPSITSLYPFPGSKRNSKYDLLVPAGQKQICEPFMGGAARSLILGLPTTLGEINLSQRAIAIAPVRSSTRRAYIHDYSTSRDDFVDGIDLDRLLKYADPELKNQMKVLRDEIPEVAKILDDRWRDLCDRLFAGIKAGDPMAGVYSFCQRTCFGTVMRENPSATAFNVSWHIGKLKSALSFGPEEWCERLRSQNWNPLVLPDWENAIEAIKRPKDCYLLLDPPYIEDQGVDRKMTPAYVGHRITTSNGRSETYALSIEPIKAALNRRFPLIHFTNYYSPQLDADVTRLSHEADYLCERQAIGVCGVLGNSSGRYKHGKRADTRPRPIEYLWTMKPFTQLNFFD